MSWKMKAHVQRDLLHHCRTMITAIDHINRCKGIIKENKDAIRRFKNGQECIVEGYSPEEIIELSQLHIDVAEEDIRLWKMEYTVHYNTMKGICYEHDQRQRESTEEDR